MTTFARVSLSFAPLIAGLMAASCATAASGPSALGGGPAAFPTNTVFSLQSLAETGSPAVAIADPAVFTLSLTSDGKLQARADCNQASAPYTLVGSTLSVGLMASTQAYCASAPIDGQYLALLGGDSVATFDGTTLQLSSPRGTLRFR